VTASAHVIAGGSVTRYFISTQQTMPASDELPDTGIPRHAKGKNRWSEISILAISSLVVLAFWGSRAEGQVPLMQGFLSEYVVEQAATIGSAIRPSGSQLADMNSISSTQGYGGQEQPRTTGDLPTVQESAVIAQAPVRDDYLDLFSEKRSQVIEYTVQEGDALGFIASDFGVSVASLIWANELRDADSISPGQVLRIPPVSGIVHTVSSGDTISSIAVKYGVEADEIIAFNSLPKSGDLDVNRELIIPDGKVPVQEASVAAAPRTRSFGYLPNLTGYFMQPTTGYNWGRIHGRNGVDMANACGTPIYAAADGIVTVSDGVGWNGGFGQYVKIRHANGTETLYAHASRVLASVGEAVAKGQQVAVMGTTGRSTGCHLHFEVHGARNPLAKY
jgi:murein DD-endopeptidase MepM/ murein hydrolase activator NlpD